jgi:hypothetical protein
MRTTRIEEGQAARICTNSDLMQLVPAEFRHFSPRLVPVAGYAIWIAR